jgi:hypothetical protein
MKYYGCWLNYITHLALYRYRACLGHGCILIDHPPLLARQGQPTRAQQCIRNPQLHTRLLRTLDF